MSVKKASIRPEYAAVAAFLEQAGGAQPLGKAAAANTEPGSIGGATTHPTKGVPDGTRSPAPEGKRSAENEKDVKEELGQPSVNHGGKGKAAADGDGIGVGGTAEDDQLNIGTRAAPTGDDPSNETESAKSGKEDSGYTGPSSHPARTDNDALNGGKYAADDYDKMPLEKLAAAVTDLGEQLCADIVNQGYAPAATNAGDPTKQAAAQQQQQPSPQIDPNLASQVGWDIAGIITNTMDKQAADQMVVEQLAGEIKQGEDDADRVYGWLHEYYAQKQAGGDDGGGPPPPKDDGGGGDGGDQDAMAAALGGGGGPPPGAGGPPPGGDPSGGAGGDPAALAELQQMLQQLGITPEELMTAIQQESAGGGAGGPPPGAGGPPPDAMAGGGGMPPDPGAGGGMPPGGPPPPPPGAGGMQVAASARVPQPTKQAVADYLREVVGRSRTGKAAAAATA